MRRELRAGREVRAAADATVSPTYVPDLVHACLDLAIDGEAGRWHLTNAGATTWVDLARSVAELAGHDADRIIAVSGRELGWRAPRPVYSALASVRAAMLPTLLDALRRDHHARTEERR